MKQITKKTLAALAFSVAATGTAHSGWIYVGTWDVDAGPAWSHSQPVSSARQTAAQLFGGLFTDYAISTQGIDPNTIDFMAYVNGYAVGSNSGRIVAQNFIQDDGFACTDDAPCAGDGLYNYYDGTFPTLSGDTSAYISDWCSPSACVNYAFVQQVPEPGALALLGIGLAGLGVFRRYASRS